MAITRNMGRVAYCLEQAARARRLAEAIPQLSAHYTKLARYYADEAVTANSTQENSK